MLSQRDRERLSFIEPSALIDFITNIYGLDDRLDLRIDELLQQYYDPKTTDSLSFRIQELRAHSLEHWDENSLIANLNELTYRIMSLKNAQPFGCLQLLAQLLQSADELLAQVRNNNTEVTFDNNDVFFEYQQIAQLWLDTARGCLQSDKQQLRSDRAAMISLNQSWQDSVKQLVDRDHFGVTDRMLSRIYKLLPKANILALLSSYQADLTELLAQKPQNNLATTLICQRIEALSAATKDAALFEQNFLTLYAKSGLENKTLARMLQFFYDFDVFDRAIYYLNEVWSVQDKPSQVARLDWLTKIYGKQDASDHKLAIMAEAFEIDPSPKRLQAILQMVPKDKRDYWQQQALIQAKSHQDVVQKLILLFALDEIKLANNTAVQMMSALNQVPKDKLQLLLTQVPKSAYLTQVVIYRSLLQQALAQSSGDHDHEKALWYYQQLQLLDDAMSRQLISYESLADHDSFSQTLKATWSDFLPKAQL